MYINLSDGCLDMYSVSSVSLSTLQCRDTQGVGTESLGSGQLLY